jgi:hypothetical protein
VDRHRLAEARSLAYHQLIAERLEHEPALLEVARARVHEWLAKSRPTPFYASEWARILQQPCAAVAAFLRDEGEHATELRQSTPFAGAIEPRERWRIWREVGARASTET